MYKKKSSSLAKSNLSRVEGYSGRVMGHRLKLGRKEYAALQRQVLERDGWRCQICGSAQDLQVHHLKFRSKSGNDELPNLIALCARCHRLQHVPSQRIVS